MTGIGSPRTARLRCGLLGLLAAVGLTLAIAVPAAQARDGYVTSFDGARIVYSFFPAPGSGPGHKAPTVMFGPGYSSARANSSDPTVAALLQAGYNVLTWDPRGFGDSDGNVEIDSPQYEGRDVQALIDYIARQPEAMLDAPGDPRLGMVGASYGGGIQLVSAAIDRRIDVIAPQIAWHSLVTSLDKANTAKGGWGVLLFGLGAEGSTLPGITGGLEQQAAGFQFGRMQDPETTRAILDGLATGHFTAAEQAFFAARGPGDLVRQIHIPTLLMQGTNDTLFTLHEAIENYAILRADGVPVKMLWFCGGLTDPSIAHGVCLTNEGADRSITLHASLNWLARYLKRDTSVDTGPRFQWISQDGVLHGAGDYPLPAGSALTASGSGVLPLIPGDTSGLLIAATPAANAVSVAVPKVAAPTQVVGEPHLTISYTGNALSADGRIYGQIVDNTTHNVVGPVTTPIPVVLDGKPHTLAIPLEGVALDLTPSSSLTLQLTDGSNLYFAARQPGLVRFSSVQLSLPTVGVVAGGHVGAPRILVPQRRAVPRLRLTAHPSHTRTGCRRYAFHVIGPRRGHLRAIAGATVTFRGRRAHSDRRGYVRIRRCITHQGVYRARASRRGYRSATARVRVAPRVRRARFTG